MKKSKLMIICLAAVFVLSLAGAYTEPAQAELPTLKIGCPLPFTGVVAESAREMQDIFMMYVDEQGGKLGGLPVEVIFEDTETQAEMVVTKARKLIEANEVHLMTGGMLAFEALSMIDTAVKNKIAFVDIVATADDFTQRLRTPYTIRCNISSSQETLPVGQYAYEKLGWRKMATIGQDYAWGWETVGGFQFAFEKSGGKVVQKLWAPIDTTDYAPYVTQLKRLDVDAIWATVMGTGVPRFVKAYRDYGLKGKVPLIGSEDIVALDAIRYFGDEALGIQGATPYCWNLDRPQMRKFVAAYVKRSGKKPSFWGHGSYVAAMWIDTALRKLQADGVSPQELPEVVRNDAVRFIEAIKATDLPDAPTGHIRMTEYNNPIRDIHLVELKKVDGEITPIVFHTFPDTTQFWKIDPEEFLAQPVFSREFPPLKK